MNQRACHRALPAALTLCLIAGCGGGSDGGTPVPGKPQLGTAVPPLDVTCSSADLSGLTSVVYAESGGNAEADCGTLEKSCGSVQNAINRCDASGCAVLVGPGEFPQEQITLRNGVHVFGGCRIDPAGEPRWRSVLRGPAGGAAAVVADNITLPTRFENLMVIGADGGSPGAPSVTIAMTSSSALTMTNSTFVGGRGATGATGATAPGHDRTGGRGGHWGTGDNPPDGQKGIPGVGGNTQASPYGGIAGAAGGSGGATSSYRNLGCGYFPGFDGKQGGTFQGPIGGGAGGFSGSTGYSCGLIEPGDGSGGALGPFGYASGPAAPASQDLLGRLVAASWSALAGGADGAPGIGGGGGGGGGAGGGCSDLVPNKVFDGGGGGGGGGGGMGGDPGRGGGMGGASIVMVMSDSSIAGGFVARGTLIPGPGGAGGAGGAGTLGGVGGAGGGGAPRPADITFWPYHCPGSGGSGGQGGIGGAGGGGAGGNGGPSIGIAYRGTTPAPPDFGVYPAQPGAAGGAVGPGGPAIFPILGAGPDGAAGQPGLGFDFAGY